MKKGIAAVLEGQNVISGGLLTNRLLPAPGHQAIGPVVLLEHTYPTNLPQGFTDVTKGVHAHPHRGIVACTYILEGELTHLDSRGNQARIKEGGLQWLNTGNGILLDEYPNTATGEQGLYHSLQFWINLPGVNKSDPPVYVSVQSGEIPELRLPNHAGVIRVLVGNFGAIVSPVEIFTEEFIYHIRLNPRSGYTFPARDFRNYAAFIPSREVLLNGMHTGKSKMVIFESAGDNIQLVNNDIFIVDIFIFGGESYTERIVNQGPFVMNSYLELADAYRDFFAGHYGMISYS